MGVNSLHKTVTRQCRNCDLTPGTSAPESSTLTARLPSHPHLDQSQYKTLIGSHTLRVNQYHQCAAAMTGSTQSLFWYLWTSALIDAATA